MQSSIRPGITIRLVGQTAAAASAQRGIAALPAVLDWGTPHGFMRLTPESTLPPGRDTHLIQETLKGASQVLVYRLNGGTSAAAVLGNLTVKARHPGAHGNNLTVAVQVIDAAYEVRVYEKGMLTNTQTASDIQGLLDTDDVLFSGTGEPTPTAGLVLSGGTSASAENWDGFFDDLDLETFQTFALPTLATGPREAAIAFTKRKRAQGQYIQGVLPAGEALSEEGIILCANGARMADGRTLSRAEVTAYIAGATAGAGYTDSLTFAAYPGAVDANPRLSHDQTVDALVRGEMVLTPRYGQLVIEKDINSYTGEDTDKPAVLGKNRVLRVLDAICRDLTTLFETRFLGKIGNTPDGRALLLSQVVGYLSRLSKEGALDGFDASDVSVTAGETAEQVTINLAIRPADSVEHIHLRINTF